jgi:hypothetical protein
VHPVDLHATIRVAIEVADGLLTPEESKHLSGGTVWHGLTGSLMLGSKRAYLSRS